MVLLVGAASLHAATFARTSSAQEAEVEGDWPDGKWQFELDGIGTSVHATVLVPQAGGGVQPADAKIIAQSASLGASYGITDHWRVGLQLPWSRATIQVAGLSRSTTSFGNAELDGWFEHDWTKEISATYGLGVAGGGQGKTTSNDKTDQDRALTNQAIANARGYAFDARYQSGRSSAIPSMEVDWFHRGFQVEPYLRVQILHDVTGDAPNKNVVTTELGTRFAVRWWNKLDTGFRTWWFAIPGGNVDHVESSFVVEPELRARFGPVTPLVGVLVPIAGPYASPQRYVSGELGIALDL